MKCLPSNKVPSSNGRILHDWHAEILAIRSFNFFLLEECYFLARSQRFKHEYSSPYLRLRTVEEGKQSFTIKEGLKFHMYSSEAPCGDASMELIMRNQDDGSAWELPASTQQDTTILSGRAYFSELGKVRRKPARADAPSTLSKSCSDKLALKQCTSLLSSVTSLLVSPENAYLDSMVLPRSQVVPEACVRAFGKEGRMKILDGRKWEGGYRFQPFKIGSTEREFEFSRRVIERDGKKAKASNLSVVWNPKVEESLINGVLQGRRQVDVRGTSSVSRVRMWWMAMETMKMLALPAFVNVVAMKRYVELKSSDILDDRRSVKMDVKDVALKGWVPNVEDDFALKPS